jgi:hypothetical protein
MRFLLFFISSSLPFLQRKEDVKIVVFAGEGSLGQRERERVLQTKEQD